LSPVPITCLIEPVEKKRSLTSVEKKKRGSSKISATLASTCRWRRGKAWQLAEKKRKGSVVDREEE
jgi:hypothetical protein